MRVHEQDQGAKGMLLLPTQTEEQREGERQGTREWEREKSQPSKPKHIKYNFIFEALG